MPKARLPFASLLGLSAAVFLSACAANDAKPLGDEDPNGGGTRTTPSAGDEALGAPGGAVVDVRAEATAVAHHLAQGNLDVATARASFTGRLDAVDFDGQPSFYLVFTATDATIVEPLGYAMRQGPALLQVTGATSAVVGASETKPEVAVSEAGLSLLFDLEETLIAMGGLAELDHLVAPLPGVLLALDKEGTYWDTKTRTALSADTLEARKKDLADVAAENGAEAEQSAQDEWSERRNGSGAPDVSLDSVKTARGNLDLRKAIDAALGGVDPSTLRMVAKTAAQEELQAAQAGQQGLWAASTENCTSWWFFGWHSSCDNVEVGEVAQPEQAQAHMPYQNRGNAMKWCNPLKSGSDTNAYLGCGPAAFTALVWSEWKHGGAFSSLAAVDRNKVSPYLTIDTTYGNFTRTMGPAVLNAMGTCSFGEDGSLTLPGGLRDGGNAWLTANGSAKRVKMIGGIAGLGASLDDMARTLHDRIGLKNLPTAAGFDLGFASSHWSPIYRYRVVRPSGIGRLQVYVQSLDWKDRWYSLGGIRLLSALAWLE